MRKSSKVLAVVLAVLMAISAFSFTAFAEDEDAGFDYAAQLASWKADYALILKEITNNNNWENWKYVAENNNEISKTMLAYSVFHMYDDAWRNMFDKSVSVANAEAILAALLEKVQADFGTQYVDKILSGLGTATTAAEYVAKVVNFINKDTFFNSAEWSDTLGTIGTVLGYANAAADKLREAEALYSQILTVKMSGEMFAEMLNYIIDNCAYDVDVQAAEGLLAKIEASDAEVAAQIAAVLAGDAAGDAVIAGLEIAMDTNVYTAAAKKAYQIAKKTADTLFNASSQSVLMDVLYSTFYFETTVNDWAANLLEDADASAELTVFAVRSDLSMRKSGNEALINLKKAQTEGWVNMVANELAAKVAEQYVAESNKIAAFETLLAADAAIAKVDAIVSVFCPVSVAANGYTIANAEVAEQNAAGIFSSTYAEATDEYIKTAVLFNMSKANDDVVLTADDAGDVQIVVYTEAGEFAFDGGAVAVAAGDVITVKDILDATKENLPAADKNGVLIAMLDQYIAPVIGKPSISDVANATGNVAKNVFQSFIDAIKNMFNQIIEALKNAFKFGK